MLLLCYPQCTTCRKAKKYLDAHGINYTLRDIKLENPSCGELALWQEKSGLDLKSFFNTSGLQYRVLSLKDRLPGMSREEMLELLAADGMLVKRPLLIAQDRVLVGFKEKEWEALMADSIRNI